MERDIKVLLADQDKNFAEQLQKKLFPLGFKVLYTNKGTQAIQLFKQYYPHITLVEMTLPDIGGFELFKHIWEIDLNRKSFMMMLSSHEEEYVEVAAFNNGVDDYVQKPIRIQAFIKKLLAIKRRYISLPANHWIQLDPSLCIHPSMLRVKVKGKEIKVTKKEFEVLYCLAKNPSSFISKKQISEEVWGMDAHKGIRTIDVHIKRLRKKIGSDYFESIRKIGYRLFKKDK